MASTAILFFHIIILWSTYILTETSPEGSIIDIKRLLRWIGLYDYESLCLKMGNTWLIPKGEEKPQDKYYKKLKKKWILTIFKHLFDIIYVTIQRRLSDDKYFGSWRWYKAKSNCMRIPYRQWIFCKGLPKSQWSLWPDVRQSLWPDYIRYYDAGDWWVWICGNCSFRK